MKKKIGTGGESRHRKKNNSNLAMKQIEEGLSEVNIQDSSTYILAKRKRLPVWKQRDEFMKLLRENQTIILVGEAGSGKSTQVLDLRALRIVVLTLCSRSHNSALRQISLERRW